MPRSPRRSRTASREVLATGDFIGGKAVAAFEQEYADVRRRPALRRRRQRHRRPRAGAAGGRSRPRRRGGRAGEHLHRHRRGGRAGPARSRCFVDVDDDALLIDPGAGGGGGQPTDPGRDRRSTSTARSPRSSSSSTISPSAASRWSRTAPSPRARRGSAAAPGAFGDVAATSFYPGKNLGRLRRRRRGRDRRRATSPSGVRLLGDHGSRAEVPAHAVGFNSRLDTLQAVVLRAKLRRLRGWNDAAPRAAAPLRRAARPACRVCARPTTLPGNEHVWHLYVVRVARP